MKLWVDDVRPAPHGYQWVRSVEEALDYLRKHNKINAVTYRLFKIELLDLDHDAGNYVGSGGDYIKILDWMEAHGINDIPIHLHTQNPVGRMNMRAIIEHNGWKEI